MIDFLIIGGGMAGLSAAGRIAPLGSTTLLEAEPYFGYHASGRSAALYEAQYGEPATIVLNLAGRDFFDAHKLLSPRGFMVLAPKDDRQGFDIARTTYGCAEISVEDARAIVPILNPDHIGFVGLSHDAMDIDTDRQLQIFAKMARDHGAKLLPNQKVHRIMRAQNGWQVATADKIFETRVLINAAGAWADDIAKLAGIAPIGITPKRRSMARIPAPGGLDVSGWPMLMDVHERWYAKPDAGKFLVSPADEDPQKPHDAWPDDMVLAEGIARYQPFVTEEVTRVENTWAGLRSFAPDKNLVIGPAPQDPAFFWLAGQGGSGIQSAPAYSQYAADLLAGRASDLAEVTPTVSPARFS